MENFECELCILVEQSLAAVYEDAHVLIIKKSKDTWLALSKEHFSLEENAQLAGEILSTLMIQSFTRTRQSGERVTFDLSLPCGPGGHYHALANFIED